MEKFKGESIIDFFDKYKTDLDCLEYLAMIKLFNNILNKEKKIVYELTKIYGVNKFQSLEICKNLNINPKLKLKQLNINIFHKISNYMEKNFEIEKNLK